MRSSIKKTQYRVCYISLGENLCNHARNTLPRASPNHYHKLPGGADVCAKKGIRASQLKIFREISFKIIIKNYYQISTIVLLFIWDELEAFFKQLSKQQS